MCISNEAAKEVVQAGEVVREIRILGYVVASLQVPGVGGARPSTGKASHGGSGSLPGGVDGRPCKEDRGDVEEGVES